MKANNQKALRDNLFLLSSSLLRFISRDSVFFQENRKVFKTGVMTPQQNMIEDS